MSPFEGVAVLPTAQPIEALQPIQPAQLVKSFETFETFGLFTDGGGGGDPPSPRPAAAKSGSKTRYFARIPASPRRIFSIVEHFFHIWSVFLPQLS